MTKNQIWIGQLPNGTWMATLGNRFGSPYCRRRHQSHYWTVQDLKPLMHFIRHNYSNNNQSAPRGNRSSRSNSKSSTTRHIWPTRPICLYRPLIFWRRFFGLSRMTFFSDLPGVAGVAGALQATTPEVDGAATTAVPINVVCGDFRWWPSKILPVWGRRTAGLWWLTTIVSIFKGVREFLVTDCGVESNLQK